VVGAIIFIFIFYYTGLWSKKLKKSKKENNNMFLLTSIVFANCRIGRFDTRLDYLHIYSTYSDELIIAIKKANSEYEHALRIAYHMPSANKDIAVANVKFISFAIEILNNCSDTNNTLCQTSNKDYRPYKFDIEPWMYYMIAIIITIICLKIILEGVFNTQRNGMQM
jgi:hypothetical protein